MTLMPICPFCKTPVGWRDARCGTCGAELIPREDTGDRHPPKATVVQFNGITKWDLPVAKILDGAADLDGVVVMGYDKDGEMYFASSYADGGLVLWLMEHLKIRLLQVTT